MKTRHLAMPTLLIALFTLSACAPGTEGDAGGAATADTAERPAEAAAVSRDWMPAAIVLPQPHTVVADTPIGLRTHYVQVIVQEDPAPMFAQWQSALAAAGYTVDDNWEHGNLRFQGAEVEAGKISVMRPEDQQGFMIQVDVTRRE